jgi:uncharacterized membrane protein (GlpM family)
LNSFRNSFFSSKSLISFVSIALLIAGTKENILFILAPMSYLIAIVFAYMIGSKIQDHGLNAAYNWSIKWALFVFFLYLTGVYLINAFVYAMFTFILINTLINPTMFIEKQKASI